MERYSICSDLKPISLEPNFNFRLDYQDIECCNVDENVDCSQHSFSQDRIESKDVTFQTHQSISCFFPLVIIAE